MTPTDVQNAKNKDLPASLIAIQRAAVMARKTALQTDTAIVVLEDQKVVRISGEALRQQP